MNNEQTNKNDMSWIIYSLLIVVIVTMGILSYIYGNFDGVSKKTLRNNYIKKDEVSFSDLPYTVQYEYVKKSLHEKDIENIKQKYEDKLKSKAMTNKENIVKEAPKKSSVTLKPASSNYNVVKCYDMKPGSYYLTQKCEDDIIAFLKANKEASKFEVIGVVDDKDFMLLNKLKNNKSITKDLGISQKSIDRLERFSNIGLSRFRVIEASWLITQITKEEARFSPVNYTIHSKKNNRGVVIRVFKEE